MASSVVRYNCTYASSSESKQPAEDVTFQLRDNTGWVSGKRCKYPQYLVLQLRDITNVTKVELLPHPTFVSTQISVYCGIPGHDVRFDREFRPSDLQLDIGGRKQFVKPGKTIEEESWKPIFMDVVGSTIMLKFAENHPSGRNVDDQVGLKGIRIVGYPTPISAISQRFGSLELSKRKSCQCFDCKEQEVDDICPGHHHNSDSEDDTHHNPSPILPSPPPPPATQKRHHSHRRDTKHKSRSRSASRSRSRSPKRRKKKRKKSKRRRHSSSSADQRRRSSRDRKKKERNKDRDKGRDKERDKDKDNEKEKDKEKDKSASPVVARRATPQPDRRGLSPIRNDYASKYRID